MVEDILVVDNDVEFRDSVTALLRADGHAVQTAGDGADALRVLDAGPLPDGTVVT